MAIKTMQIVRTVAANKKAATFNAAFEAGGALDSLLALQSFTCAPDEHTVEHVNAQVCVWWRPTARWPKVV